MVKPTLQTVFEVLGNKARRDILSQLGSEPMYFNQLTKKVGIGQQAMLRHLKILDNVGFIRSYNEKSDLGAPDRKFYRLNSSFMLSIFSTQDEFSIKFDNLVPEDNKKASELKNKISENEKTETLDLILYNLVEIDKEIKTLREKLHHLSEMRQVLLHRTNQIGKSKYKRIGQKVLYQLVTKNHDSLKKMSEKVEESTKDVKDALGEIQVDLHKGHLKKKVEGLLV
ncbi:MAG: ArsR/SmtB family transcription factor [Nitrosopumilaceae archaeon]